MSPLSRIIAALIIVAALGATYVQLQKEQTVQPVADPGADNPLVKRIRDLPEAPASWRLIESAPEEINNNGVDDIQPTIRDMMESAASRVTIEGYFLKKSWGKAAQWLRTAPARNIQVLGVLHSNEMSDAKFLDELRTAGAQIVERDIASAGGNPVAGYIHSKFVVVDGERGYIGSANFGAAAMRENREMGLYFEDDKIARTLERMAQFDAKIVPAAPAEDIRSALLLQGAPESLRIKGLPICEEGINALCRIATRQIDIMMLAFSHQNGRYEVIASALRSAVRRGVKVRLIHDASSVDELKGVFPTLRDMKQWGVHIRMADISALGKNAGGQYHAKAMRVDDQYLMIGSNNWTDAASHENREVAVILRSDAMVRQFNECFETDWTSAGYVKPFDH